MQHSTRRVRRCAAAGGLVSGGIAIIWLLAAQTAPAQQPPAAEEALRDKLAAGAIDEALAQIANAPDVKTRDLWLAQVALAQARANQPGLAVGSLGQMANDQARAAAIDGIRRQVGGQGGAAEADFDSLIDLIVSTIEPTSWDEVGGPGSVAPFPTGVYVDASGELKTLLKFERSPRLNALYAKAFVAAATRGAAEPADTEAAARRTAPQRKISLGRLARAVADRLADGQPPSETMQVLAGLQRIEYILAYPDDPGVVLVGPAGDWTLTADNRIVATDDGLPVVRLDDLVVVFRHVLHAAEPRFGCLIKPTQEALARTQQFLDKSSKKTLRPGQRSKWLAELRAQLGAQDIEVYGLDARTRAARVMIEADYRMKLVGMGLEEGVPGVTSYLAMIELPPGEAPPPLGVLRWWFALDYEAVVANPRRTAFVLRGQGIKVLSENERLAADGRRVHTGKSEELNRQFAARFTARFDALCRKYPIYAELRNLGDLALAAAVIREHDLLGTSRTDLGCFAPEGSFPVVLGLAPRHVQTVINHRVVRREHIIAGVSGGVAIAPEPWAAPGAVATEDSNRLDDVYHSATPNETTQRWWWD